MPRCRRESDLQYDPNMDGLMLRLARVVAEQYFGVMVTPVPDSRAVSEALANYVASETVRALRPREAPEGTEKMTVQRGSMNHSSHDDGHEGQEGHKPTPATTAATTAAATKATTVTTVTGATTTATKLQTPSNRSCDCRQYEVSMRIGLCSCGSVVEDA